MTTRIVELRRGILKKNDELAAGLRTRYTSAGVLVLNLVSSPGTGKTAFLELTLRELRARGARVAALVGGIGPVLHVGEVLRVIESHLHPGRSARVRGTKGGSGSKGQARRQ